MYIRSSSEVLQQLVFGPAFQNFLLLSLKWLNVILYSRLLKTCCYQTSGILWADGPVWSCVSSLLVRPISGLCVCVSLIMSIDWFWLLCRVFICLQTHFDGAIASQLCKTQSEKTSEEWSWDQTWRPDSKMVLIQARELEVGGLGGGRSHWSLITDHWFGQWGHSWSNTDYCN